MTAPEYVYRVVNERGQQVGGRRHYSSKGAATTEANRLNNRRPLWVTDETHGKTYRVQRAAVTWEEL